MPTQSTDILNTATDGIDFTTDAQTWTIAAGVVVSSTQEAGILSNFKDSVLFNFGSVFSGAFDGVAFDGSNGTFVNEVGAAVRASNFGVFTDGDNSTIDNLGDITGFGTGVVLKVGKNSQLINHGSVYGHDAGVVDSFDGSTISNFGAIQSDKLGVKVETEVGQTTYITNATKGIIKGTTDAINSVVAGAISLNNHGTLIGNIDCTVAGANDVVINHGKIKGAVHLGSGDDVFNGIGGKSGWIYGGDGNDTLTGGAGADHFVFDTALNAATNVDKIKNFTPKQHDKIVVSKTYFAGIGPLGKLAAGHFDDDHAAKGSPEIIYTQGNGHLYYDANGNLPGGMTHFATLFATPTTHPVIHATDFIVIA